MGAQIRRIAPGEGSLLRDVRLAALADTPGAFATSFAEESKWPADAWEAWAAERSDGHEAANFVVESAQGVLGLVGAHCNCEEPATVELVSMWVAPHARGRGLGAQLVERVVEWAEGGGAVRVALWVMRGNDPAISLYRRVGFVATDLPDGAAAHPCNTELRMVRDLAR